MNREQMQGELFEGLAVEVWQMSTGRWVRARVRRRGNTYLAESTKLTKAARGTGWRHLGEKEKP